MARKQVKDHISGCAQSNLNAASMLFDIDVEGLKNASPEALAGLKDLQEDAIWWAKNGEKVRKDVAILAEGTAQKNVTFGMIAQVAERHGKSIVNAKYNAALSQKKFGNFLEEKKLQAQGQFGQENARHSTEMQFIQANNNLQQAVFRANVQARANQLQLKAQTTQHQLQSQHQNFVRSAAMQLGSNAPFLPAPGNIQTPRGISASGFTADGMPSVPTASSGSGFFGSWGSKVGGFFGGVKTAVNKVRGWFGI